MTSIKAVAQQAGVSVGTVSNVLNRPWVVARERRALVQQVMADLGYVPNAAAKALRRGNRHGVVVLVDDLRAAGRADLLAGLSDGLESTGRHVLLHNAGGLASRFASHLQDLGAQGARAVIVCADEPLLEGVGRSVVGDAMRALQRQQRTVVVVDVSGPASDTHLGPLNDTAFTITSTALDALESCLALLAARGYQRIDLLGERRTTRDRLRQIKDLASAAGLRVTARTAVAADGDRAVVLCDSVGVAAVASIHPDARPTAVALDRRIAGSLGEAAYPVVAGYDMGKIAVDVMLTDPDPVEGEGAGLRLPAQLIGDNLVPQRRSLSTA